MTPEQELSRRSRRAFMVLGAGAVAGFAGLGWLDAGAGPDDEDIPRNLRRFLRLNEKVVRSTIYGNDHLTKTYSPSEIGKIKVNGTIGMEDPIDLNSWKLSVTPYGAKQPSASLTMDDLKTLPRNEEIIDFKCVEGWSTVTQFAGARLSDFTAKFASGSDKAPCVGMNTPDEEYYVGLDTPSALHPQTLLAWEMNGEPLSQDHGAPIRLVIPVKYGIKNIKRIAKIEYTDARPKDYWGELGYDWYAGL